MAGGDPSCDDDRWLPSDDPSFKSYVGSCLLLVIMGGIMSGLQQGLMQLDRPAIKTMKEEASPLFLWLLRFVEPLIERRHLTLVTLLISNAAAMESLPIFFDALVPKAVAILFSVSLLLIFGEIIPQALCLKYPGELACIFAPLVWFLLVLFFPVSYPISLVLDWMLGAENHQVLSRAGLKELAQEQSRMLTNDELDVITGALDLHSKVASDVCLPIGRAFMLSYNAVLSDKVLRDILDHGHSRVPIWRGRRDNIVGLLLVKHLIRVDPAIEIKVSDLQIMPVFVVREDISLFALLRRFRTGASHMAVVVTTSGEPASARASPAAPDAQQGEGGDAPPPPPPPRRRKKIDLNAEFEAVSMSDLDQPDSYAVGILTLEDVMEQLLKHSIEDETDVWKPVNDRLDQRLSKVRSLREDLLTSLQKSQGLAGAKVAPGAAGAAGADHGASMERDREGYARGGAGSSLSSSVNSSAEERGRERDPLVQRQPRPASRSGERAPKNYGSLKDFADKAVHNPSSPSPAAQQSDVEAGTCASGGMVLKHLTERTRKVG
jgi:metal transporter CNNM